MWTSKLAKKELSAEMFLMWRNVRYVTQNAGTIMFRTIQDLFKTNSTNDSYTLKLNSTQTTIYMVISQS